MLSGVQIIVTCFYYEFLFWFLIWVRNEKVRENLP